MKSLEKKDGYMVVSELGGFWGPKVVERVPLEEWYQRHPEQRPGYTPSEETPLAPSGNNADVEKASPRRIKETPEVQVLTPAHEEPQHKLLPINARLCIIDQQDVEELERGAINQKIDQMIISHSYSRQEINRLVFESVAALTTGEDYERQLANKKGLRRFIGSITGSNKKLQDKINSNRTVAQYAAQQTLQRLAEQSLMTFDLIATVNNKLNAAVLDIEGEINEVYSALVTFFKQSRSDMVQMESRVERLEKNVNLLNWQNAIEYQMFNGMEYADLDDATKIVCLTRDFYNITKGEWTTSDLLLLKTAMSTVDLSPKRSIDYFGFIKTVAYNSSLSQYLLDGKQISQPPESYLVPLLGIKKLALLDGEERFIIDTITDSLAENGVSANRQILSECAAKKYLMQETQVNPETQINCYDLIMEMLFNLREAEDMGILLLPEESETLDKAASLERDYQKAAELFKNCQLKEAHPLLIRLSEQGFARANALLHWLCNDGYPGFQVNGELAKEYATKGYHAGDAICALQYALFCVASQDEKESLCAAYKPKLEELADAGDVFATYMLGICYTNVTDKDCNYFLALQLFMDAASQNFYRAFYSIALRYYYGQGVEKSSDSALLWVYKAIDFPQYLKAFNLAGDILGEAFKQYQDAYELFKFAADSGDGEAYRNLGVLYNEGWGVSQDFKKAADCYEKAAELGDSMGQFCLGQYYLNGTGAPQDRAKAQYWLEKSAEQGLQRAIDMLKQNFG